jgi:putative toxin-antitoxin system antitoxin component (TIGR02293 family)
MAHAVSIPDVLAQPPRKFDLESIEKGIPLDAINEFARESALPLRDIYDIVIPARTFKHRRTNQQPLSLDESDKLARLVRVYRHAVKVFGNPEKSLRWLAKPNRRFEGRTPLHMVRTDSGGRLVEELLGQIDHGFFA